MNRKILWSIIGTGALLRLLLIGAPLEYDEIWTLEYFSPRGFDVIFSELALPNNQPLNSAAVKLLAMLDLAPASIRLVSVAAGVASIPLIFALGFVVWGSRAAGLWSAFFMAFSAPAIFYSQQARGYSLQLFFLLLFASGLAFCGAFRPRKWKYAPECAAAAGGVGAILTLSTSVIFLGLAAGGAWLIRKRLPNRAMLGVLGGGALFSAMWYTVHFSAFAEGRKWGAALDTAGGFFEFGSGVLSALGFGALPASVLIGAALLWPPFRRKRAWILFGIAALSLLSALATRGGPPRVYLPLAAVWALLAGCGGAALTEKFSRPAVKVVFSALIVLSAGVSCYFEIEKWRPPDWTAAVEEVAALPEGWLAVCRATDGYPVVWNFPRMVEENGRRIASTALERHLLIFERPGRLNGADADFAEQTLPAGVEGEELNIGGIAATRYRLEKLSSAPRKGETVIVLRRPSAFGSSGEFEKDLSRAGKRLILNIFFRDRSGGGLWAVGVEHPEMLDPSVLPADVSVYRLLR